VAATCIAAALVTQRGVGELQPQRRRSYATADLFVVAA
jgi:hypothetical protein